jgi:hypothetical protein
MDQKRFKQIRESGSSIKVYSAGQDKVEVRRAINSFDVYMNDQRVESFKTQQMALEIAEEASKALGK